MTVGITSTKQIYINKLVQNMIDIAQHPEGQALSDQQIAEFKKRATADADALEEWLKNIMIIPDPLTGLAAPNGPVTGTLFHTVQ